MRPVKQFCAAMILLSAIACAASGCYGPSYGYEGYPAYGYAPYSYGWGGWAYDPAFVVHHPWEDHYGGEGHHTEFYHGTAGVHETGGGGGFHGGGGGGAAHGGGGGGGHGGGGGGHH